MSELEERLGTVIRAERQARGLSQERLAQLADLDRTHIQRIERGKYSPKLDTLDRIARALQRFPSELIALADGSEEEDEDEG